MIAMIKKVPYRNKGENNISIYYGDMEQARADMLGGLLDMIRDDSCIGSIIFMVHGADKSYTLQVDYPCYYSDNKKTLFSECLLRVYYPGFEDCAPHAIYSGNAHYTQILAAFGANIKPIMVKSWDVEETLFDV